jgi:hypothetical protein
LGQFGFKFGKGRLQKGEEGRDRTLEGNDLKIRRIPNRHDFFAPIPVQVYRQEVEALQ